MLWLVTDVDTEVGIKKVVDMWASTIQLAADRGVKR